MGMRTACVILLVLVMCPAALANEKAAATPDRSPPQPAMMALLGPLSGEGPMSELVRTSHPCLQAYSSRETDLAECERLANSGNDPDAEYWLAHIRISPGHPARDFKRGEARLRALVESGPHAPAAYQLGVMHGVGHHGLPDYAEARTWLEKAAGWGNFAAKDLLATYLRLGLGGPADRPRAVKLYREAAVKGWRHSLYNLFLMQFQEGYGTKDPDDAMAFFQSVADRDDKQAAAFVKTLKHSQKKNTNLLVIPKGEEDFKVTKIAHAYTPIMTPALGFLPEVERLHFLPISESAAEIDALRKNYRDLITPYFYEIARHTAPSDPQTALAFFLLGKMRMEYDARRCKDAKPILSGLQQWFGALKDTMAPVLTNGHRLELDAAYRQAMAMEEKLGEGKLRPYWVCGNTVAVMKLIEQKKLDALYKPRGEWKAARDAARESLRTFAKSLSKVAAQRDASKE